MRYSFENIRIPPTSDASRLPAKSNSTGLRGYRLFGLESNTPAVRTHFGQAARGTILRRGSRSGVVRGRIQRARRDSSVDGFRGTRELHRVECMVFSLMIDTSPRSRRNTVGAPVPLQGSALFQSREALFQGVQRSLCRRLPLISSATCGA